MLSYIIPVSVTVGASYIGYLSYQSFSNMPKCTSKAKLDGKTVIITGANTGIGLATARDMARRGARVILACRSLERANTAAQDIISTTENQDVIVKQIDLTSMESVRNFAAEIYKEEARVDILINNAGLSALPHKMTSDGIEITMAANHHGHFLLTNLLLDKIKKSAPSRIVNLSSLGHKWAKLDWDKINGEMTAGTKMLEKHEGNVYFVSKLCNILFTKELSERLQGTGVTCNSVHPGTVKTELFRNSPGWLQSIVSVVGGLFLKSPEQGAQTSIHCAVSEDIEGVTGRYFSNCRVDNESEAAKSTESAKKLWDISAKLTGLNETTEASKI
ncbi:unnamed protein product [Owenia fusiformis]|uniref:Retinol dehydrogenase 13 n=1 Tax=Owenia fusiformis TaxID=6347 RepID=A0A8S4NP89_OWEFU|nr:unnamed protein product [Owenia fusiformis]